MTELKGRGKSILIGGLAAGLISIIPIINLLNLLFMMWMGFGGGLSVYLLSRDNRNIRTSDALLTGSLSGLLGSLILGLTTFIVIVNISPEKIEKLLSLAERLLGNIEGDILLFFQEGNFKIMLLILISVLALLSIISGAIGGIISKYLFRNENHE